MKNTENKERRQNRNMKITGRYQNLEQQVLDNVKIVNALAHQANIRKVNNTYIGDCTDKYCGSGTVIFDTENNKYQCACCNRGGNVINYISEKYKVTYSQAIEMIAEKLKYTTETLEEEGVRKLQEQSLIKKINNEALVFYENQLWNTDNPGIQYLRDTRKLSDDIIRKHHLGYSSGYLMKHLMQMGYSEDDLLLAGIAKKSAKDGKVRDAFWNRVMFPIFNTFNECIGFGGRILESKDNIPKYINTSDTPLFNKSINLYGLNNVITTGKNSLVLCEGYMDVISMSSVGILAVAGLGTALTSYHAKLIHDHADTVYLAYDSDEAGKKAGKKNEDILRKEGLKLKFIDFSPAKDGDEFLKTYGAEALKERIINASEKSPFMEEIPAELNVPEGVRES